MWLGDAELTRGHLDGVNVWLVVWCLWYGCEDNGCECVVWCGSVDVWWLCVVCCVSEEKGGERVALAFYMVS